MKVFFKEWIEEESNLKRDNDLAKIMLVSGQNYNQDHKG